MHQVYRLINDLFLNEHSLQLSLCPDKYSSYIAVAMTTRMFTCMTKCNEITLQDFTQ